MRELSLYQSLPSQSAGYQMHLQAGNHEKSCDPSRTLHRLHDLSEEMPFWGDSYHQLAFCIGQGADPPVWREWFSSLQPANANVRESCRCSRKEWHWKKHGSEDSCRSVDTESWKLQGSAGKNRLQDTDQLFQRHRGTTIF